MRANSDIQYGEADGERLLLELLKPDPLPTQPASVVVWLHSSRRSVGSGRVISGITIATRSCAATHSRSGLPPVRR